MADSHQDDPFDLLGLEPTFRLDRARLERAYLVRAAAAHPDASGTDVSAAQINEAKRVLEDPERRANALLARLGGPSKEDHRDLPPGFLMEIMETREEMESLVQSDDARGLARFRELALNRRSDHIDRIGRLFDDLGSPPEADGLARIRVELNAWRYAERMIEQITPHAAAP